VLRLRGGHLILLVLLAALALPPQQSNAISETKAPVLPEQVLAWQSEGLTAEELLLAALGVCGGGGDDEGQDAAERCYGVRRVGARKRIAGLRRWSVASGMRGETAEFEICGTFRGI
jgi:hypothetical protein